MIIILKDMTLNEVDLGVDLGVVEVVEVASGEDAMREVVVVSEADVAVLEENVAVLEENVAILKAIATGVIEVVVGAIVAIRMALATEADVGATVGTIRMVVAAVLEAVVAVLEAVAAVVVLEAVSKVGNRGVETISRGNRGVIAEMAIGEVFLETTKAVLIRRNPLISIHLKIKRSLLMINCYKQYYMRLYIKVRDKSQLHY